ncbi:chaperone NapD [Shewanella sp. Isolate11]|uniref:chaperone NapD n=1 Tax=Shewanella sp. Isolate11 TaxID=2908530 RepID=UPI001EFC418F|nr:chaperone NapD [Shewanella sp. Isolate11]MCG9695627.1 chaperone NapD [Shewanella sp. Isolate11]
MSQEYHVTSLVVHASPNLVLQVKSDISALVGADIHAITDEGKFIITLEGATQASILDNVETINALNGVLSSSLVYHQVEPIKENNEETP